MLAPARRLELFSLSRRCVRVAVRLKRMDTSRLQDLPAARIYPERVSFRRWQGGSNRSAHTPRFPTSARGTRLVSVSSGPSPCITTHPALGNGSVPISSGLRPRDMSPKFRSRVTARCWRSETMIKLLIPTIGLMHRVRNLPVPSTTIVSRPPPRPSPSASARNESRRGPSQCDARKRLHNSFTVVSGQFVHAAAPSSLPSPPPPVNYCLPSQEWQYDCHQSACVATVHRI